MSAILDVKGIAKNGILGGVSLTVEQGEMVAIMGPSGSGKSTLLYNISGMDQADAGESCFAGNDIVSLDEDDRAKLRLNKMGFVFQQMNVISNLNVLDNIMFPARHALKSKEDLIKCQRKALEMMKRFGLEGLENRKVTEVSGGQLQRVCIIRSMIMEPALIFADEPTGALNQSAAAEVMESFLEINRSGTAILMVTHDMKVAMKCDRIIYLVDGKVRGELALGKFIESNIETREKKASEWLSSLGW